MKKFGIFCMAFLALAGCDKKEKTVINGQRERVFTDISDLKAEQTSYPKPSSALLSHAQENTIWPMAGGTSHHVMAPALLSNQLHEIWRVRVGTGSSKTTRLLNGPISSNGHVFTIDAESMVSAVDIRSGKVVWQNKVTPDDQPSQPFGGGLAYENGRVFVASASAEILALNEKDGQVIWRQKTTAPVRSAPCVYGGHIYVVTINNQLEVFNTSDGSLLWSHTGTLEVAGLLGGASPAVQKDVVITAYTSGEIFALRCENGYPLWSETLGSIHALDSVAALSHIKARPIIDQNRVILISHGGRTSTLDLRTGKALWSRDIAGTRSPALIDRFLYMVTSDSQVLCLDADKGTLLWVSKLAYKMEGSDDKTLWAGPVLTSHGLVLTSTSGQIVFCAPDTGKVIQTLDTKSPISISPIVVQKTLLVLTDDAELIAYR